MKSKFVGALVVMLMLPFSSVCFASTDLCKEYAVGEEYDKAIEECTKQINGEVKVKYIEYSYSNRGAAYANKKQYDEAISDYNKAIELNPGYATAYYNRAIAYANKKHYDEAVSDYNKAIELNPRYAASPSPATKELSASSSPAASTSAPAAKQAGKAIYSVQLGVFKNENNAAALAKQFKGKGYDAFVMAGTARDKGTLYRVLIGRFEDKGKSAKLAAEIKKKENITPIVFSEQDVGQ